MNKWIFNLLIVPFTVLLVYGENIAAAAPNAALSQKEEKKFYLESKKKERKKESLLLSMIPTQIQEVIWEDSTVGYVQVPDWDKISLSDLPGILTSGSFGNEFNGLVGYDLSRVWNVGDTPDQFLKLGDIAESLAPQNFSVGEIAYFQSLDLSDIPLSEFPLVGEQTLNELVKAVPFLGLYKVNQVLPVKQLLTAKFPSLNLGNMQLGQVLVRNAVLRNSKLEEIDLSVFSVASIPNIDKAVLAEFNNWQNSFVKDVPGLGQVPLAQMPNSIPLIMKVTRIDSIWSAAESQRNNTVSGSYQEGFSVPCSSDCAYIELDDLENIGRGLRGDFEGKQWISGLYQQVNGGSGCLASVNGGIEPTGRHPFGSAFKVAVMEPDESSDTVDTALYFRFCIFCGCTPYFIGPIPFLSYQRDDFILSLSNGQVKKLEFSLTNLTFNF